MKEGSIDTQDNQLQNSSGNSSTKNNSVSSFGRRNSKYSLNTDAGRKNILVLCLLVVCLVGNFNESRSNLGKSNILKTDLEQILQSNRAKLMEALEGTDKDLKMGINHLNSDFVELTEESPHLRKRPNSIVKMNGLVPFVANRLPFDKNQEDSLYELCMKYANVNLNKQCTCQCPETLKRIKPIRAHPIKRFSQNLPEKHESGTGLSLENLTLSKHVKNTKALEPYQSQSNIIEENEEIHIFDTEEPLKHLSGPKNSKAIIEFREENPVTLSLDNFKNETINEGFKFPRPSINLKSTISELFTKKKVKTNREQFMYKCHLDQKKENSQVDQFNLVLAKSSFDKLVPKATYSAQGFMTL